MNTINLNEVRYQNFYGKAVGGTSSSNNTYISVNTLHRKREQFKKEYAKAWMKYLTNSITKN